MGIKRDPSISNAKLPSFHGKLVGEAIIDRLNSIFDGTPSAIPPLEPNSINSSTKVLSSIQQLMNLYLINGFAYSGKASIIKMGPTSNNVNDDVSGTEFQVTFASPATLWSGQSLQKQNACVVNDFFLKSLKVLLDRGGYTISK